MSSQMWPAKLTDGETARSSSVRVRLDERGIAIEEGGQDEVIWPYGALGAEPALGKGAKEALVTYKYAPGAMLFVQDGAFVTELRKRAPRTTSHSQRWRWAAPMVGVLAVLLAGYLVMVAVNVRPARMLAGMIPATARDAMGQQVAETFAKKFGVCKAPRGEVALRRMVDRLLGDNAIKRQIKVGVLDWDIVNALTGPGGYIFLTKGLIRSARTPEEVVGVLAHEIGHARALHPETNVVRSVGISVTMEMILGGSGVFTNLAGYLTQQSYARDDEREADRIGLSLLRSAQISQRGLERFFKVAATKQKLKSGLLDFLSSHPAPEERLAAVKKTADYKTRPALEPRDWIALRVICSEVDKKDK